MVDVIFVDAMRKVINVAMIWARLSLVIKARRVEAKAKAKTSTLEAKAKAKAKTLKKFQSQG